MKTNHVLCANEEKYQSGLIIFIKKLHLLWKIGAILFQDNNTSQPIFNHVLLIPLPTHMLVSFLVFITLADSNAFG